jgi:hypothetical protein
MSRFGFTYKTGFGMDDLIYCTVYIHTVRDYRQHSAIAILHTLQFPVAHALGFSVFCSRILETNLSPELQIRHEVFSALLNSFLAIILHLPIRNTRLDYTLDFCFNTPTSSRLKVKSKSRCD